MSNLKLLDFRRETPEELTSYLEELLAEAKEGKIKAVAVVTVLSDGGTTAGWAYDAGVDTVRLIGGAFTLANRLQHAFDPEISGR